MKTYSAKPGEVPQEWYVVDAADRTLGRLASEIAKRLRGKHKPQYTPHTDTGDYIVVINAEKIAVTGNKRQDKLYYRHSGHVGKLKVRTFTEMLERCPEKILQIAVKGMLPRNPLGRAMLKKLRIYTGEKNPHQAQNPQPLKL